MECDDAFDAVVESILSALKHLLLSRDHRALHESWKAKIVVSRSIEKAIQFCHRTLRSTANNHEELRAVFGDDVRICHMQAIVECIREREECTSDVFEEVVSRAAAACDSVEAIVADLHVTVDLKAIRAEEKRGLQRLIASWLDEAAKGGAAQNTIFDTTPLETIHEEDLAAGVLYSGIPEYARAAAKAALAAFERDLRARPCARQKCDYTRLVLLSSGTPYRMDFRDMVKTLYLEYDFSTADSMVLLACVEQALLAARAELGDAWGGFESIGLACHGPPDDDDHLFGWKISEKCVIRQCDELHLPSSHARQFVVALGKAVVDSKGTASDGRVDLFACSLLSSQEGRDIFGTIGKETRANFAASTNLIGNPKDGGGWVMESVGVDVRDTYFWSTDAFDGTFPGQEEATGRTLEQRLGELEASFAAESKKMCAKIADLEKWILKDQAERADLQRSIQKDQAQRASHEAEGFIAEATLERRLAEVEGFIAAESKDRHAAVAGLQQILPKGHAERGACLEQKNVVRVRRQSDAASDVSETSERQSVPSERRRDEFEDSIVARIACLQSLVDCLDQKHSQTTRASERRFADLEDSMAAESQGMHAEVTTLQELLQNEQLERASSEAQLKELVDGVDQKHFQAGASVRRLSEIGDFIAAHPAVAGLEQGLPKTQAERGPCFDRSFSKACSDPSQIRTQGGATDRRLAKLEDSIAAESRDRHAEIADLQQSLQKEHSERLSACEARLWRRVDGLDQKQRLAEIECSIAAESRAGREMIAHMQESLEKLECAVSPIGALQVNVEALTELANAMQGELSQDGSQLHVDRGIDAQPGDVSTVVAGHLAIEYVAPRRRARLDPAPEQLEQLFVV